MGSYNLPHEEGVIAHFVLRDYLAFQIRETPLDQGHTDFVSSPGA